MLRYLIQGCTRLRLLFHCSDYVCDTHLDNVNNYKQNVGICLCTNTIKVLSIFMTVMVVNY